MGGIGGSGAIDDYVVQLFAAFPPKAEELWSHRYGSVNGHSFSCTASTPYVLKKD